MFLGEHQHSLDAKGRVILPARFRDQLEQGAVMAKALDGCLAVYPMDEFQRVADKARELAQRGPRERQAARAFFAGATEFVPDKQGRVAIPQPLRDFAGLTRDVIVAGVFHRIEIWDARKFRELDRAGDESLVDATDLPDFGI
jgi:MraZ protein